MKRDQFEHILRAAAEVTGEKEFVVIGSQAALGQKEDLPVELVRSVELDLYPLNNPAASDEIDGAIGELSPFHDTYGIYAHGVGPETAQLPTDWRDRASTIHTTSMGNATAVAPAIPDLVLSKLVRNDPHDQAYFRAALAHAIVRPKDLMDLTDRLPVDDEMRANIASFITDHALAQKELHKNASKMSTNDLASEIKKEATRLKGLDFEMSRREEWRLAVLKRVQAARSLAAKARDRNPKGRGL